MAQSNRVHEVTETDETNETASNGLINLSSAYGEVGFNTESTETAWGLNGEELFQLPAFVSRQFVATCVAKYLEGNGLTGESGNLTDVAAKMAVSTEKVTSRGVDALNRAYVGWVRRAVVANLTESGVISDKTKTTDKIQFNGQEVTLQSVIDHHVKVYSGDNGENEIVRNAIRAGENRPAKAAGGKPGRKSAASNLGKLDLKIG